MDSFGFFSKFYSESPRLKTKPRLLKNDFTRPRRDQDFCKMIFQDRDETEKRNLDREILEIETETRVSSNPAIR